MQKISPCFWFDNEALEATGFYTDVFSHSEIIKITYYPDDEKVLTVRFKLMGYEFNALNGGPYFKINPSISIFVNCESHEELINIWEKLSRQGEVLMELGEYPFSKEYGWVKDKYGVTWQVNLSNNSHKVSPFLMFCGDNFGKAEEAINFYCSIFEHKDIESIYHNEEDGTVFQAVFKLFGEEFTVMDSGYNHGFTFSEGLSFYINCKDQNEIDYLWDKLTKEGEESLCGWLKDKYGVWWQIVNDSFEDMISKEDPARAKRVMDALYKMKKIDIKALKEAYEKN